jgi:WD40 repeat protein
LVAYKRSVAADFDVVTDWVFFFHTRAEDRKYRQQLEQNPDDNAEPNLVPPILLSTIFVACILGSIMWLVLATDGAIVAPILRRFNIDKISMGHLLFLCVLVEDLPQVVLTFLAEDYYEEGHEFNTFAMVSVIASLYDTLIKLAEAFDERADVIETGIWCKDSLWAHKKSVTAVVAIDMASSKCAKSSRVHVLSERTGRRQSVFEEVREITKETKLPRLRFLSTSADRTTRLWDTDTQNEGPRRSKCVRSIRGHLKSVTCVAFLGNLAQHDEDLRKYLQLKPGGDEDSDSFFLTGSDDGKIKLFNLLGKCFRTYFNQGANGAAVTCVASVIGGKSFISGCITGNARLWDIWSGECIAKYEGHSKKLNSVCSLGTSGFFISASDDTIVRLWDTKAAIEAFAASRDDEGGLCLLPADSFTLISDKAETVEKVSKGTFVGHTRAVLSLACVDTGIAFLSGSEDHTARLWSVETKSCLRIFSGHGGPVTSVATVDSATFLTGSADSTIKVWDAFTAGCIRTYTGHTETVTSVSMAENGTFISSSEDKTIKLWVFTAVTPVVSEENLQDMLGMDGDACLCMV